MDMSAVPGFVTLKEAAERLRVSHSRVASFVRQGRLQAVSLGQQKLIPESALSAFRRGKPGRPPVEKKIPETVL